MGTEGTAGHRMNYGTVRVLPATGNGVHGYGYGVGKPDPRYTRVQPYSRLIKLWPNIQLKFYFLI